MVREVLTNNTFASCSWPKKDASVDNIRDGIVGVWLRFFENNDRISKGCVVDAWRLFFLDFLISTDSRCFI